MPFFLNMVYESFQSHIKNTFTDVANFKHNTLLSSEKNCMDRFKIEQGTKWNDTPINSYEPVRLCVNLIRGYACVYGMC